MKKGFTLLELLIVIATIAIMSALVFAGAGSRKQQFALQRSTYKLAQDIRRAGEMGMSAREFEGGVPEGGYGIYINTTVTTTSYILFADKDDFPNPGDPPNKMYDSANNEKVEDIKLEKKVYIQNIEPASPLNITFKPPNPTITITSGGATTTNATTTLSLETNPESKRKVIINKAGLIDID